MLQGLRLPNIGQDIQNNNETTPYYKIMLLQADLPKLNRDYALKAVSTDAESFVNGAFESALPWSTIEPSLPAPAFDFKTYLRKFSVLDAASTVKKSYTSNLYFNMLSETEDPARLNFPSRDMLLDMPYFDKVEKFDGDNALPVSYFEVLVTRTKSGNDVEVQGVAAAERDRLLGVAKSIRAGSFKQSLLFMANPLQYEHTFIENDFDTDKCVFMRSNLSLETHRAPVFSAYALTNKARRDVCTLYSGEFAMMLWECSVVGGSGYYLRLLNKSGNPLPEDAFDERGQAKLIFVVYDDNQYALTKQSLSNAVVTKPSTDGDDMVFVSKTASDSRLLTSVASMPPGCVGFTIEMEKPPEDSSPLSHTRELYNILEYFIEGESLREDLPNSPPLLPTDSDSESLWQYSAVIPTHKLIKDGENVFDAVGGKLNVRARLRDVLGNRADGALYLRDIPILYNDTLINISTWPNTSLQFDVSLEDGKRYITVVLTSFEKDTKKDLNPSIDLLRHAVLQLKSDMQLEFTTTLFDCTWTVETSQLTTYADKLIKYLSGETPDLPECTWKFEIQGDQSGQNAAPLRYTFKDKGANEILFESDAGVLNEASNKTASDSPYQLCVTLRSYRTKHLTPYTDFNEYRCTIAPNIKAGDTAAQVAFAKSFETAFPHLKLALGGENDSQIYIVPGSVIGSIKIKPVSINVQDTAVMAPCFTSIRPLSNKRVSRTVSVNALNDDGTLSDISADVNYFNVDMDLMAQRFIGDFEQFLDSNAARWATTRLQGLITAKEKLAKAISKQLTQVAKGFSAATELPRNILNDRLKHSLLAGERLACIAEYALTMNAKSRVRLPVQLNPSEEQSQKEKVLHAKAGKIDSAEKSFCIMYSSDILAHSGFDAKFSFTLPELEYDIVADENGYERSKWLRFILPIEKDTRFIDIDFDMRSDIQVPNPLRNCPIEPSLLGHNCVFDYEQLYNFKYELYMNAEIFEQDTYHIDVFYKNVFSACKGQARDLFSELCRYDYVREKLSEAMSSDNNATLANAVSVFAGFVDSVSAMWEIHTGKDIKSGSGDGYKLLSADVNAEFDKQGAHMRVNSDRKGVSARFEGAAVPGMGAPFTLSVEELNVYDYYRLASSAFTVRNSNLLRLNDEVNLDVNECFIYRSGTVTLPFINTGRVISKEILVGTFGEDTFLKELPSALEHLFVALGVEKRGLPVELAVSLSFSSEEFEVELPIGLFPANSDMSVLKSRLVEGITQWYALSAPAFGQLRLYLKAEISAKLESATLITFSRLRVDF